MRLWLFLPLLAACANDEGRVPPSDSLLVFDGAVPSNLLVLSIDTLRRDHLGAHGDHVETPFLDGLAAQGVVLEDHLQCSNWTTASTACTQTGSTNLDRETQPSVGEGIPEVDTLPTWLSRAGFATAFATGNSYFGPDVGSGAGFDEVAIRGSQTAVNVGNAGLDKLEDARKGRASDPWYLHLHFMEPHILYHPNEEFLEPLDELGLEPWPDDLGDIEVLRDIWNQRVLDDPDEQAALDAHLRRLYRAEVRTLDHRMAFVWDKLADQGLLDDTLVVVWTDHGEQFWERGSERGRHTHAFGLGAEENDAVLWFWADNLEPGRLDLPSTSIDLVPTLLDLYGIDIPKRVTGSRLADLEADRPRFGAVNGKAGRKQHVVVDDSKLIYHWKTGTVVRYDRAADPEELVPLPTDDPETEALWCHLWPKVQEMAFIVGEGAVVPPELVDVDCG